MVFLSIVIPSYNSEKTLIPLLQSIKESGKINLKELEIIIVNDCSNDSTIGKVAKWQSGRFLHLKMISLGKNQGPAAARNIGVKYAKGEVVLFLDSDVLVYSKTISEIVNAFKTDPDLHALTGVWDKKQKGNRFFPKFKALRDWSYWINERDPRNYYYLFSTRVAAIRKELFKRLGGFDVTYKAALVEDMELTYRIVRRYAVVFNPKVIVHHEFEDFLTIAKKYFLRSFYWSRIYRERKKFDPVATTGKEALTTLSAGILVLLICLYFGISIMGLVLSIKGNNVDIIRALILNTLYLILFLHFFLVRKFLWFCVKEEGWWFAFKAFFTGIALYIVILAGAAWSFIKRK